MTNCSVRRKGVRVSHLMLGLVTDKGLNVIETALSVIRAADGALKPKDSDVNDPRSLKEQEEYGLSVLLEDGRTIHQFVLLMAMRRRGLQIVPGSRLHQAIERARGEIKTVVDELVRLSLTTNH